MKSQARTTRKTWEALAVLSALAALFSAAALVGSALAGFR